MHSIVTALLGGGLIPPIKQVQKQRLRDASYLPKVPRITNGESNLASACSVATWLGLGPCGRREAGAAGRPDPVTLAMVGQESELVPILHQALFFVFGAS